MQKVLLLLLLGLACTTSRAADPFKGYLVTLNGRQLTGYIDRLFHSSSYSQIVFINDFGTAYAIQPLQIMGFVYVDDSGNSRAYASKLLKQNWSFLHILVQEENISLYQEPLLNDWSDMYWEQKTDMSHQLSSSYWLEINNRRLIKVKKWGFKRQMRRLFEHQVPELAAKIGMPGYQFKDLVHIIKAYNEAMAEDKRLQS
ncbi:MAG TPA: hypothetical protein PKA00_15145 [Saprospiraceae bacterium]|nr:hypothetical protein [Saprospiraceae bacterium]HMQ84248.1 hypothetical protein [Saprospiraceae bacterium]